jgi:hypothetical protein
MIHVTSKMGKKNFFSLILEVFLWGFAKIMSNHSIKAGCAACV